MPVGLLQPLAVEEPVALAVGLVVPVELRELSAVAEDDADPVPLTDAVGVKVVPLV